MGRGVLMGAADVVPGVSGGTVALLLGIYARLIDTMRAAAGVLGALLRGNWRDASERLRNFDWWFAVPLVVGIVIAVVALASVIDELLADEPEAMAGTVLRLGDGIGARGLETGGQTQSGIGLVCAGGGRAVLLGCWDSSRGRVDDQTEIALFGSGIVAVCAMLLPGISGAFILLMLGGLPDGDRRG